MWWDTGALGPKGPLQNTMMGCLHSCKYISTAPQMKDLMTVWLRPPPPQSGRQWLHKIAGDVTVSRESRAAIDGPNVLVTESVQIKRAIVSTLSALFTYTDTSRAYIPFIV